MKQNGVISRQYLYLLSGDIFALVEVKVLCAYLKNPEG